MYSIRATHLTTFREVATCLYNMHVCIPEIKLKILLVRSKAYRFVINSGLFINVRIYIALVWGGGYHIFSYFHMIKRYKFQIAYLIQNTTICIKIREVNNQYSMWLLYIKVFGEEHIFMSIIFLVITFFFEIQASCFIIYLRFAVVLKRCLRIAFIFMYKLILIFFFFFVQTTTIGFEPRAILNILHK